MASISSSSDVASYATAARMASLTGATRPVTPGVQPAPTVTAGTAATDQASAGAAQAQSGAQTEKVEQFNAPRLQLPPDPSTRDVMAGLVGAMSDPSVNATTAEGLYKLHDMLMQSEKTMLQVVLDGLLV